jgi:hypothetical protein
MPSFVLYKSDQEGGQAIKFKGNFTDGSEIIDFCNLNSINLIQEYSEDVAFKIFGGAVSVFYSSNLLIYLFNLK